jgi:hypothetical protein
MALQLINIGHIADDGTGDSLRVAFQKINSNTTELIGIVGSTGSVAAVPNTTVVRDSNADIYTNKAFFKNLFPTMASLPAAVDRGGMIVYVVNSGAYVSNNVAWKKLPFWNSNTVVTDAVLRWDGAEFVTTDPGVKSFNSQTGDVVLTANDINTALGANVLTDAGGRIAIDADGNITFGTAASLGVTGFMKLPTGTSMQRPLLPEIGMIRYNSDLDQFEGFIGPIGAEAWRPIGPLGTGSATFTNITVTNHADIDTVSVGYSIDGPLGKNMANEATVTTFTGQGLATFEDTVTLTSDTISNALGTGALVITGNGGASIGGNLYVGGYLAVNNFKIFGTTQSTSPSTGALTVVGGVGVGKNLNVGQNFTAVNEQINNYTVKSIKILGLPNDGSTRGYLLLAKAYVGGFQDLSYVSGDIVLGTGDDVTSNRMEIYRVLSSSAYDKESFTVQVQSGQNSFFVRTVKVTYSGVVYHAIETTAAAGPPDNGVLFYGSTVDAELLYVDATYVTAPTVFGSHTFLDYQGNLTVSGILTNNYIEYTSGVKSPRPADIKSNSIHGFNAYSSTDFPSSYFTGWTVKGPTVGAQLAVSWNTEEDGTKTAVYVRANDDTTDPTEWSTWERVITASNLPVATSSVLGNVKIGTGINVAVDGTISAATQIQSDWTQATTTALDYIKNKPTYTTNGVAYASSTSALSTGSALTFNGTDLTCTGNITAYSDIRLKTNLKVIDDALAKVNQLSGYTFERTDIDVGRQTGVIAQEVKKVLPEAVTTTEDGMYTVAYGNMVGLLIESIKELTQQVADLKSQLQDIKK